MKQLRYGFRLIWREVPADCRRYKIGQPGSFDRQNGHDGVCWAWPSECKLTNSQAKTVFYNIYKKRSLTLHQLLVVRKALAYAYELTGGEPKGNYKGVKAVWTIVREAKLLGGLAKVVPERIPTVRDKAKAFTTDWTTDSTFSLVDFSSGVICAYDCFLSGLRPNEDVMRLKKSRTHSYDWENGWQCTAFKGGRAKLSGTKKDTRPWSIWTVCFCKGPRHQRPPSEFCYEINKAGNPRDPSLVNWTTTCPLAALELLWQLQDEPRRYGRWLDSGRFGSSCIKDPVNFAIDWFQSQGVSPRVRYDHNSGRKGFARLARHLRLEYPPIFQVIGDLEMYRYILALIIIMITL